MTIDFSVTRRALSLGDADSVTGWYAKVFTPSTIEMILRPKGSVFTIHGMGYYARHALTGYTQDPIVEDDEIIDAKTNYYEVKTIEENDLGDNFIFRECELAKLPLHADRPATSGTWPTVGDARYQTRDWLKTYLDQTKLKEDNNTDDALYIYPMGLPDYHIERVFLGTKGVDLVFSVGTPESVALPLGVGYLENVPISIFTVNKAGITGTRLRYAAEVELKRIAKEYPLGSLRTPDRISDNEENLGSTILYSVNYILRYKRYS